MKRRLRSFCDLRYVLQSPETRGTAEEKVKTEDEIFAEAMADVREIPEFREIPYRSPEGVKPFRSCDADGYEELRRIVGGKSKIRLSDTGEYVEWLNPSARKDLARRLHHGEFCIQDTIDLHGMVLAEAEEALVGFIAEALRHRHICVKIIHGRGLRSPAGPVLKEAVTEWLQSAFRKWVLAYASAKDCDGGLGATYVLLNHWGRRTAK